MASAAYYDRTMSKALTKQLLNSIGAKSKPARSTASATVYGIDGGGEAMVEKKSPTEYRTRLYKGKCPC